MNPRRQPRPPASARFTARVRAFRCFPAIVLLGLVLCCTGRTASAAPERRAEVEAFIADMAQRNGLDPARLRRLLAQARPQPAVIAAMAAPATARPWYEYYPAYVSERRIRAGLGFWNDNAAVLARASAEYGVPEEIIVATLGVETWYGTRTGSKRVLDVLATLAFDYPPRAAYFRGELEQFLLLARKRRFDPLAVKGSYAGAMGMPQFMPTSMQRFAIDFDGDGRVQLWDAAADSIGSVAHYYKEHGWQPQQAVVAPAGVAGEGYRDLLALGVKPQLDAARLATAGVTPAAELPEGALACLIALDLPDGPQFWLGLENFYVITRYNRSVNYAMSVYRLAQEIRALRDAKVDTQASVDERR